MNAIVKRLKAGTVFIYDGEIGRCIQMAGVAQISHDLDANIWIDLIGHSEDATITLTFDDATAHRHARRALFGEMAGISSNASIV